MSIEGIIENVETPDYNWWMLQLAGQKPVQVHNNRVKELGELKKGDKVRYEEGKSQYGNDSRPYAVKLEKVP